MGAGMLILNLAAATLPGLFWLWWFLRKDHERPEPKRLILIVFLLGFFSTIPAIVLELGVEVFYPYSDATDFVTILIGTLLIVAPIEELVKFLSVRWSVFRSKHFDEGVDGVVYMVAAGLGFATAENMLIVMQQGVEVLPLRLISATLLHALASGLVGYFLGLAKFYPQRRRSLIFQGLLIGIILHGLYNFIAVTQTSLTFILLVLLVLIMYRLLSGGIQEAKKEDLIIIKGKRYHRSSKAPSH